METEPKKPQEAVPAPARDKRQAWWWGIYLSGAIGVPFLWTVGRIHYSDPLVFVFTNLLNAAVLPTGLGYDFSVLCENLLYRLGFNSVEDWEGLFVVLGLPLGYAIFIVHYQLASEVKTRRAFLLLMLSLVLLVGGSLVGFVRSAAQAFHH